MRIIYGLGLAGICLACNPGGTSWETDMLAPIARTTLDIDQLTGDTLIKAGPDGRLWISFDSEILDLGVDTLADLGDFYSYEEAKWPLGDFQVDPGIELPLNDITLTFGADPAQLTYARVKDGELRVELRSAIPRNIQVTYEIPLATKNGYPLLFQEIIPAFQPGGDTVKIVKVFPLGQWDLDLRTINQNFWNRLSVKLKIKLPEGQEPFTITLNQFLLSVQTEIKGLKPQYARGYFGQQTIYADQQVKIHELQKISAEEFDMESAEIRLRLVNSLGADIRVLPISLTGKRSTTGETVAMQHAMFGVPVNLTRAQEGPNMEYPLSESREWIFNAQNSNILDFITLLPDAIIPKMDVSVNPMGNISGHRDFLFPAYPPQLHINVNIPLKFSASSVVFADTVEADMGGSDWSKHIVGGYLRLIADNGYPFEMQVTTLLLDQWEQVIDSLYSDQKIQPAPLEADGMAHNKVRTVIMYPVTANLAEKLPRTRKMFIRASMSTKPTGQMIQLRAGNVCDIQFVADLTLNPNP